VCISGKVLAEAAVQQGHGADVPCAGGMPSAHGIICSVLGGGFAFQVGPQLIAKPVYGASETRK
jgi:acid phosphatase family membrane protein YuiD